MNSHVKPSVPGAAHPIPKLVLIGSSTGGVEALLNILGVFPKHCPPTVIVQHTSAGFGDSLTNLLGLNCAAETKRATDGIALRPGRVVIAAGTSRHFKLLRPAMAGQPITGVLGGSTPICGHCPSVNALFHSAVPFANHCVAALLTGMGEDGADGLLALRKAGATTFAQDEASSVIYGMPAQQPKLAQCAVRSRSTISRKPS